MCSFIYRFYFSLSQLMSIFSFTAHPGFSIPMLALRASATPLLRLRYAPCPVRSILPPLLLYLRSHMPALRVPVLCSVPHIWSDSLRLRKCEKLLNLVIHHSVARPPPKPSHLGTFGQPLQPKRSFLLILRTCEFSWHALLFCVVKHDICEASVIFNPIAPIFEHFHPLLQFQTQWQVP